MGPMTTLSRVRATISNSWSPIASNRRFLRSAQAGLRSTASDVYTHRQRGSPQRPCPKLACLMSTSARQWQRGRTHAISRNTSRLEAQHTRERLRTCACSPVGARAEIGISASRDQASASPSRLGSRARSDWLRRRAWPASYPALPPAHPHWVAEHSRSRRRRGARGCKPW